MKACPFCAEDIQEAAVVCKHCGHDVKAASAKPPIVPQPRPRNKSGWIWWLGGSAVILFAIYSYGTSADSVDLSAALELKTLLEKDGILKGHTCNPNRTTIPASSWNSLGSQTRQENLAQAMARICISRGASRDMTVIDTSGRILAVFDGWKIER